MPEPRNLRRGKLFHKKIQREWDEEVGDDIRIEHTVVKPSGRQGRVDIM